MIEQDILNLKIEAFINHVKQSLKDNSDVINFWIDLFCGAGGTSTGIQFAQVNSFVAGCVNHDEKALDSHEANHPFTIHFREDIRNFEVVLHLKQLVKRLREEFPDCFISVWASLECTNFSNAKGGQSRDADSRTLANHMFMYLEALDPDYFWIENVKEFMAWGPMFIPVIKIKPSALTGDGGDTCSVKFKRDKKSKNWITEAHWKPISKDKGKDYLQWIDKVKSYGYNFDWEIFNAADFGSYQSRERLFLQFAKKGLPINWPEKTHSKRGKIKKGVDLFSGSESLNHWKAVRDILDLMDTGKSIFDRNKYFKDAEKAKNYLLTGKKSKEIFVCGTALSGHIECMRIDKSQLKEFNSLINAFSVYNTDIVYFRIDDLSENTLKRIYAGLIKFVAKGKPFIIQRNNGNPNSKVVDVDGPARTLTSTAGNQDVVFLNTYYGNGGQHDINEPSPTATTKDRITQMTIQFIMNQFSGGGQHTDLNNPSSTVTNIPKQNLISTEPWIMSTNFSNVGSSIHNPFPTITANRKHHYLINANSSTCPPINLDGPAPAITQRTHLLINPSWGGHPTSTDEPCVTVIARQDKAPLYLLSTEAGEMVIPVYDSDNPTMVLIKEFMIAYKIKDIRMRMLKIVELLQIQGFPVDYKLKGSKTDKKKFIGNAVEVTQAMVLADTHYKALVRHIRAKKRLKITLNNSI